MRAGIAGVVERHQEAIDKYSKYVVVDDEHHTVTLTVGVQSFEFYRMSHDADEDMVYWHQAMLCSALNNLVKEEDMS